MEQLINQIISELYVIDPELKKYEKQLGQLIAELIATKPNVSVDETFAKNLRKKLEAKASLISTNQTYMNDNKTSKFSYIFSGALTVVVAVAVFGYFRTKPEVFPQQVTEILSSKVEITKSSGNAFGSLALNEQTGFRNQSGGGGLGGGGSSLSAIDPKIGIGGGGDMGFVPPMQNLKYTYVGDKLPELAGEQSVLRRLTDSGKSGVVDLIKKFSFGLININKFTQVKLQNFTLSEDKEFGYGVSVDLTQGSINIYQNWEKWPHPEASCQSEDCYRQYRVKLSDIPEDSVVLGIAKNFLTEYGVPLAGYSDPIVQKDWLQDYERSADKSSFYIPDSVSVVFPLIIEGKSVLDEGGNPTGISVSVDARNQRVNGVYGLFSRKYEQSNYQGETDQSRIIKIAETGGFRNYLPYSQEGAETLTVELGTPKLELVQIWHFANGASKELYVPAYVFPVRTPEKIGQVYLPKHIVVPLVKELLNNSGGGPVNIMNETVPAK